MKILYIITTIFVALFFVNALFNGARVAGILYELPFPEYYLLKADLNPIEEVLSVITITCLITIELRNAILEDKIIKEVMAIS